MKLNTPQVEFVTLAAALCTVQNMMHRTLGLPLQVAADYASRIFVAANQHVMPSDALSIMAQGAEYLKEAPDVDAERKKDLDDIINSIHNLQQRAAVHEMEVEEEQAADAAVETTPRGEAFKN
jgi:hypothetical protein